MKTPMVICAAYLTLAGGTAWANDEALRNGKPHVAEIVTLARLAPRLCGGILADEAAIQALMDTAGLSEGDVQSSGRFGADDTAVAQSFAQSVDDDPVRACSEIFAALGPEGGGLLRKVTKPMT